MLDIESINSLSLEEGLEIAQTCITNELITSTDARIIDLLNPLSLKIGEVLKKLEDLS